MKDSYDFSESVKNPYLQKPKQEKKMPKAKAGDIAKPRPRARSLSHDLIKKC